MQIRLGTLNAWALPEPLSQDLALRIDAIGGELSRLDLDVIAFQEVWTADTRRSLREAGREAGLTHAWGHRQTNGGGLLVLSRHPISEVAFEPFALRGEPELAVTNLEYLSGKGFARIRIETPAGPLDVVDTHLHARYSDWVSHLNLATRLGQVLQLSSRLSETDDPVVVVGDFNFLEGELDYRFLTEILGLRDTAAELDQRQPTIFRGPYRPAKRFDRRKDFVFARDGRSHGVNAIDVSRAFDEVIELDGRFGTYSNHAGLVLTFELGATAAIPAAAPDRSIFERVAQVLAEGERQALRRREFQRALSTAGAGVAVLAGLGMAPRKMNRRRLLRLALGSTALLALAPSIGLGVASELLLPGEIRAFRDAASQLALLDPDRPAAALSS